MTIVYKIQFDNTTFSYQAGKDGVSTIAVTNDASGAIVIVTINMSNGSVLLYYHCPILQLTSA